MAVALELVRTEAGRVWKTMAANKAFKAAMGKARKIRSLGRSYVFLETG